MTFSQQLAEVQAAGEDFEWYPTTDEIIAEVDARISAMSFRNGYRHSQWSDEPPCRILDVGAGNGKVLMALKGEHPKRTVVAIEKSAKLMSFMDPAIQILGTDFWMTSLLDKEVDIIFSNPPYREYVEWTMKIINEAPCGTTVLLVIPQRWEDNDIIKRAISLRGATAESLGTFTFDKADRRARAVVNLVEIDMPDRRHDEHGPFVRFFDAMFPPVHVAGHLDAPPEEKEKKPSDAADDYAGFTNRIEWLVDHHDRRMHDLRDSYSKIVSLPPDLLLEFGLGRAALAESLLEKTRGCRRYCWEELFKGLGAISARLTNASKEKLKDTVLSRTDADFSRDTAYAIVEWVIKNANQFTEEQTLKVYEDLIDLAAVEPYKSNQKVFTQHKCRYDFVQDKDATHYRLKVGHRIVLQYLGGIRPYFGTPRMDERTIRFLQDLAAVGESLGFLGIDHEELVYYTLRQVKTSAPIVCTFKEKGKPVTLYEARCFQNGNVHIRLHADFMGQLNAVHGRLKGWLRSGEEAAAELETPKAAAWFDKSFLLGNTVPGINTDTIDS